MSTATGTRLQRSQDARRARVIDGVLELLGEGGYDQVRLRDVWDRTGVGTDTIYRYFGSREGLICAALDVWLEREFLDAAPSWMQGATPAEQVLAMCRATWDVWERNAAMLEPFVRAALADERGADGIGARALRGFEPHLTNAFAAIDPSFRVDFWLVLSSVTHSAMTSVIRSQLDVRDVYPILERTVRRLAQHPAMDGARPRDWDYGWTESSPRSPRR